MEPRRHPIHDTVMIMQLIELVKKYPSVWQPMDESRQPVVRKKRAWEQISLRIGVPKDILVKKWRNLTHTFFRISKELKHCGETGKENIAKIRKRWFLYEHMAFLEGANRQKRSAVIKTPEASVEHRKLEKDNNIFEQLEVKQEIVEPEIHIFEPSADASSTPGLVHESFIQPTRKSAPRLQNEPFNSSQSTEEKRNQAEAHFPLTHSLDRLANEVQNLVNRKRSPCAGFGETIAQELEQFDRANRLRIMGRISNLLKEEVERVHSLPRNGQSPKFVDDTEENRET